MPQETLTFPPLYCLVGAYRLFHDPTLWRPMWAKCSKAAKQASIVGFTWALLTWPFQKLFVYYFMSASASVTGLSGIYWKVVQTADVTDDKLPFRIPVPSLQNKAVKVGGGIARAQADICLFLFFAGGAAFATFMFVIGQVHAIMEFWLRRKLKECRSTAYVQTVKSRGKAADWWTEYVEEFSNPPTQKAIKDAKKQGWYLKLASPLVRFLILKVFLLPVDFVPFFGMALGAALRSLTYGRTLHTTFFEAKRMSPFQIELWITERQHAYRSFGFVAALMERIPLIGMVFSISNRIGAAMWAHDLEKRQQRIRAATATTGQPFSGSSSAIAPATGGGGGVGLEEFKSKPTLKKIYKTVQQESHQQDKEKDKTEGQDGGSFNGEGQAILRSTGRETVFTNLSFTFPLKLIAPRTSARNATFEVLNLGRSSDSASSLTTTMPPKPVSPLYIVGYGGGLVSGDSVDLDVDVGSHCTMLILTQGSTKVFKTRNSHPTQGVSTASFTDSIGGGEGGGMQVGEGLTRQNYRFLVRKNATLVLLPDPVTCFANASYDQVQRFDLRSGDSCSLVVLDWITSGRALVGSSMGRGEGGDRLDHLDKFGTFSASKLGLGGGGGKDYSPIKRGSEWWIFDRYKSRNEVRIHKKVVARDVVLLSQHRATQGDEWSEIARRNHPFGCYATLLLAGPDSQPIVSNLMQEFQDIQQRPTTRVSRDHVLWSLSSLEDDSASSIGKDPMAAAVVVVVVRLAANDSQSVRQWLHKRLYSLQSVIGTDLYRQALAS
ncbi:uncharacterized protein UTRI_05135 [Ustilago trichophora]|uniref:Urease accessory protein UreD n=1 Tax=Ustilago trichophora TaxID=86804 RepID=A0A5C3EBJ7_9BASI|nr:uncharacterized protein UTRI_05135 [Ustilago trichophora]